MNSKEKIIAFMWAKEHIIANHIGESGRYFKKEDEELIHEWDQDECKRVWARIYYYIFTDGTEDLTSATCPFCLFLKPEPHNLPACSTTCEYKDNHGGYDYYSQACSVDWSYITNQESGPSCHALFPNEVYRKIIGDIENA